MNVKKVCQVTGFVAAAGLMLSATPVLANVVPEMNTWYEDDYEYAELIIKDEDGKVVSDETSVAAAAELSNYTFFDTDSESLYMSSEDVFYFVDCGVIKAYDKSTGEKLWENYDFQGYPGETCYQIDEDGTLYTAGYNGGPDLFAVDSTGETLIRVSHLECNSNEDYFLICGMQYDQEENSMIMEFEAEDDPDYLAEPINLDDYAEQNDSDEIAGEELEVVNCDSWVSLRAWADTSAERMTKVPLGAKVTCLNGTKYNDFYYVEYQGYHGYVLAAYLKGKTIGTPSSSSVGYTRYIDFCDDYVTLRKTASTSAASLAKIPLGDKVTVIGDADNDFAKVTYKGKTGYVLAQYLAEYQGDEEASSVSSSSGDVRYIDFCDEYVTLRKSPSTSALALAKIPLGSKVTVYGDAGNGFAEVTYKGQTGYVLSQYLAENQGATESSSGSSSSSSSSGDIRYIDFCDEYVTMRKSPSTSAAALAKIPLGSKVTVYGDAGNGFAKVTYKGQTGYVLSQYLAENQGASESSSTSSESFSSYTGYIDFCDEYVTMRKSPSTSAAALAKIPLGDEVTVIGDASSGFAKVKYNGQTGYVLSKYIAEYQ